MSSYASAAGPPSKQASLNPSADPGDSLECDFSDCKTAAINEELGSYILGTLMVRVVAARKLSLGNPQSSKQRRDRAAIVNPYASVRFYSQSQRTTECYSTSDPIWPRGETMFMDVTLPLHMASYKDQKTAPLSDIVTATHQLELEEPVLTIALFHNNNDYGSTIMKKGKKGKQQIDGDSDEPFLGMASVNIRKLLTGKISQIDEWLELSGGGTGAVRLVLEYEPADPPPRPGDTVRFTRFCNPRELYPIPHNRTYQVVSADETFATLSTMSPEGWVSTFQVHRHMLLCEERHQGAVQFCHDELELVKLRFAYSPMVHTLGETIQKVPEEGLINVSFGALQGGMGLLGRWWQGGVDTAMGDIMHATNWDGRHDPELEEGSESDDEEMDRKPASKPMLVQGDGEDDIEPLPGMPCCPITGQPMRYPVVAGDGHTYERSAIARWLQNSDKSPLTGSLLPHKELVPNYGLISSLEDASRKQEENEKSKLGESKSAALDHDVFELRKSAPSINMMTESMPAALENNYSDQRISAPNVIAINESMPAAFESRAFEERKSTPRVASKGELKPAALVNDGFQERQSAPIVISLEEVKPAALDNDGLDERQFAPNVIAIEELRPASLEKSDSEARTSGPSEMADEWRPINDTDAESAFENAIHPNQDDEWNPLCVEKLNGEWEVKISPNENDNESHGTRKVHVNSTSNSGNACETAEV